VTFVLFPNIKNCHNSRMLETPYRLGFANKALAKLLFLFRFLVVQGNRLQGDQPVDLRIASLVNDAHGSASQLRYDLIPAESSALSIFHGQRAWQKTTPTLVRPTRVDS